MPEKSPDQPVDPGADLSRDDRIALTGGQDFWHLHAVPAAGLPGIMVSDGPHGLRKQTGAADHLGLNDSAESTCFPPAVGLAASWSPEVASAVGAAIAEEALAEQVSVVLGPGMNIKRSPLCGRNFEYFSEDPILSGAMATGYVRGMQERGVGASVKHFALNNQETDRMRVDVQVDERTMHEIYLRPFRTVVTRAQPWTVMCSYNSVQGTTVAENRFLLTEVLREQWGYDGVVVSDWGAVVDRPSAVTAGLDLQMPADAACEQDLREAVETGQMDLGALERASDAVARLIRRAAQALDPEAAYDREAHHQVALEAARRAIVLLSNDGVLPLEPTADIAIVGDFAQTPRYQGAGSSHVNPTRLSTALEAIGATVRDATGKEPIFARGVVPGQAADPSLLDEAVEAARRARTVLVFMGLGEDVESEGYDRTDMELPEPQLELLRRIRAVNDRVVVLLSNGSAVRLPEEVLACSAVLETWLLGQAGGEAVADVVFGRVDPSGRLAESFPQRLQDVPSYLHFPGEGGSVRYGEGLFVGYRGLDAVGAEVAFPFGHGLSYTSFELAEVTAEEADGGLRIEVTVTNTGERTGREVVQVYTGLPDSTRTRPLRELKGFGDVELEAGASGRVRIDIPAEDLQIWDPATGTWHIEGGTYRVDVGVSSRDLRRSLEVTLEGDMPVPVIDETSTPLEVARVPGGAERLEAFMGGIGIMADPEMRTMAEQIPLGRLTGIGGISREELAAFIASVNG